MKHLIFSLLLIAFANCNSAALAGTIYVDNLRGSDAFDGRSPTTTSDITGPTKTIRRALAIAGHGDTISIRNNGEPYYESVTLSGHKHSGAGGLPFTINGNGVVIDGSDAIPAKAWYYVGANLWRFTPWRKGYYGLYLDDKPVPRHVLKDAGENPRAAPKGIPAGQWAVVAGTIYYQAAEKEDPTKKPFRYAARGVGLTLYNVIGVYINDLTFRNFRLDGVNAHDRCGIVKFDKVKSFNNARSGFAVGGCSGRLRMLDDGLPTILLQSCEISGNAKHSIRFTNRGTAQVEETKLDKAPTVEN